METKVPIVDLNTNTVSWCGKTTKLRPMQTELMLMLVRRAPGLVRHGALIAGLWGDSEPEAPDNAIKVHVSQIRRALGPDSGIRIISLHGLGYRLELDQ